MSRGKSVRRKNGNHHTHGKNKNSLRRTSKSTFHGLHNWHNHLFTHLGWMVLAKERGYSDKIMTYKSSIHRIKTELEKKIHDLTDSDRKEDLRILYHNICVLEKHANMDF